MSASTRPYHRSGLYARPSTPPAVVEQAMAELRAQLLADKGGPDAVSTAERMLIDLAVAAKFKLDAVTAYLLTLPSPVDKRHRRVWQVIRDSTALATHLQSLLRDLGLERRARDVETPEAIMRRLQGPAPKGDATEDGH